MEEELISNKLAILFAEKGFNSGLHGVYNCIFENDITAEIVPQSLIQKWLRDIHQIEMAVQWFDNCYIKAVNKKPFKANTYKVEGFQTYEEALESGLIEALNLI